MVEQARIKRVMRMIAAYLVENLMQYKNISRDEAVILLMKTTCYMALMDPKTELYDESREAVLDALKEELEGNPYRLLDL